MMTSILERWFLKPEPVERLKAGIYQRIVQADPAPYRLHLRVDPDGSSVLIVNAATVLHLNETATLHAYHIIQGSSSDQAAEDISHRYRVNRNRAREDFEQLAARVETLATNPDVDPVFYLEAERTKPHEASLTAPYRLDLALTYETDPDGEVDPLARARVDRELDTAEWKQILQAAWGAGIPHVTFTGGEPTRRDDLVELVAYAQELGQVSGLLSDGRRLGESALVERLSQAGLDHFLITLVPDSERSVQGLKNALESDVFTAAHLTLTPSLLPELGSWLGRLVDMGVPAVSFSAVDSSEGMVKALRTAREQAAALGLDLVWDLPAPFSKTNPIALELEGGETSAPGAHLYVEPDGDVLPGQGIDRVLGNMLRDDWETIWSRALSPSDGG
jgi:hypothetical protein